MIREILILFAFLLFTQCKTKTKETDLSIIKTNTLCDKVVIPNTPKWLQDAVFYEIYPQSFYDSDGNGIGDIPGIIEKLDYVKSLGVKGIWMNPIYVSPFRDAGYDVADYFNVAPRYGTKHDLKRLFDEVHKRGMYIIIDCIFGHTSVDHPWFKESCKTDSNKYTCRYIWTNSTWTKFDLCGQTDGTTINGFCNRDGNFMTNFFWAQPALNFGYAQPDPSKPWELSIDSKPVMELREDMKSFLRYWLDFGCDGFHMDMASSLVKRDTINKVSEIWKDVRKMLNEKYPNAFIVPEWCVPIKSIPSGFHSDFWHWVPEYFSLFNAEKFRGFNNGSTKNHSFFDEQGKGDITSFIKVFLKQNTLIKDKGYGSFVLSNLNLPRTNINRTQKDLEIIQAFMLTMPGIPFFWYGEEIGMHQLNNLISKEGSYCPRTGTRSPMQWDDSKNMGFSKAKKEDLYIPIDTVKDAPNVKNQDSDPNSLLNSFRKLTKIHNEEDALKNYANISILYAKSFSYPFIYARSTDKEIIVVILNPINREEKASIGNIINLKKSKLLAGDEQSIEINKDTISLIVKPVSFSIYKVLK